MYSLGSCMLCCTSTWSWVCVCVCFGAGTVELFSVHNKASSLFLAFEKSLLQLRYTETRFVYWFVIEARFCVNNATINIICSMDCDSRVVLVVAGWMSVFGLRQKLIFKSVLYVQQIDWIVLFIRKLCGIFRL